MTRSELIYKLKLKFPKLSEKEVEAIVVKLVEQITEAISEGGRVEIRGFGAFSFKQRASRQARNPRNGDVVAVEDRATVYFRAGKDLRDRINRNNK
jgi:integration host factor subunit beta